MRIMDSATAAPRGHDDKENRPVTTDQEQQATAAVVDAVQSLWDQARLYHPDVPAARVVLGRPRSRRGAPLWDGHLAYAAEDGGVDLVVEPKKVLTSPEQALVDLLHEVTHARARVLGIKETSSQRRYHNADWRDLAEAVGLTVRPAATGWAPSGLAEHTAAAYAPTLQVLAEALGGPWSWTPPPAGSPAAWVSAACACTPAHTIRAAPALLASEAAPVCPTCDQPYQQK